MVAPAERRVRETARPRPPVPPVMRAIWLGSMGMVPFERCALAASCQWHRHTLLGLFELAKQTQEAVEDGEGMRRTSGDVEIDWNRRIGAIVLLGMIDVGAAGDG